MATAPKSNSATEGLSAAKSAIKKGVVQSVPLHLRDSHNKIGKQLGHGDTYEYSHDYPEGISGQEYLEKPLKLYRPKQAGAEAAIAERLERWAELKGKMKGI